MRVPRTSTIVVLFGVLLAAVSGVFVSARPTSEHWALLAVSALVIGCGLFLLSGSEARRKIVVCVAAAMVVAGFVWRQVHDRNRASALVGLSGLLLLLLLLLGRAGRERRLFASVLMLLLVLGYGHAAYSAYRRSRQPPVWVAGVAEGAHVMPVALNLVDPDTSWTDLSAGKTLPEGMTVGETSFVKGDQPTSVSCLKIMPLPNETNLAAAQRAADWIAANLHLSSDRRIELTNEPAPYIVKAFVLSTPPLLEGDSIKDAEVQPPAGHDWSVVVTFAATAHDRMARFVGYPMVISLNHRVQFGPLSVIAPTNDQLVLRLGTDGTEERAKFLATALRGGFLVK